MARLYYSSSTSSSQVAHLPLFSHWTLHGCHREPHSCTFGTGQSSAVSHRQSLPHESEPNPYQCHLLAVASAQPLQLLATLALARFALQVGARSAS